MTFWKLHYGTSSVCVVALAKTDVSLRKGEDRTALDEALVHQGTSAETYFPVHRVGPKRLERTIEILRSRLAPTP